MASSSFVVNELPDTPRSALLMEPASPSSEWAGIEEIPEDQLQLIEPQNEEISHNEEAQEHVAALDLNQRPQLVKGKELTTAERLDVLQLLLAKSNFGVLKRGATKDVAVQFGVGIRTIQRIWKCAKESGNNYHQNFRVKNCGRKRVEFDLDRIRSLPLSQRTTLRSLAKNLGVSKSFLHQKLKEKVIRRHTSATKPTLTTENEVSRINHCLHSLVPSSLHSAPTFQQMANTVHIDEKWFYLTKRSQTYYMLHDEPDPVRTIKSSHFIPKVMFLVAVSRPRFDSDGLCTFDGKIGLFPLVQSVAAVRSSHNRPRGTIEIKPIANITRDVVRAFMISKVLPAIVSKWPRESINDVIYIQQDNAKSHIHTDDVEFLHAVQGSGLRVSLVCQPPNSPDLNVLDLGFFRAIQSLQSKECAMSIVQLVAAVEKAFEEFSVKKCNFVWITLQACMIEILKKDGSNNYKIPHLYKDRMHKQRVVPISLSLPREVVANAFALLAT